MKLVIDHLCLRLPAGFEGRTAGIVKELAQTLAGSTWLADKRIDRLALPPLQVGAAASDREIAGGLATAIRNAAADARGRS